MFIASWDYTECMQVISYQPIIVLTIIPLSAVTTDNGSIFDVLVIIGLKSILSCRVGARLILLLQIICCNTSAPIDNYACFLLAPVSSA